MAIKKLNASDLYQNCDTDQLGFNTTADLEALTEVIGQDRVVEAVRFGIGIQRDGYNLYALGPKGLGKHSLVHRYIEEKAKSEEIPSDWCYVNNFKQPHKPRAIEMPPGMSHELGIDISKGKLNHILIENKERYHQEKDRILSVGLQVSSYINVDDTGARHKGKNGYCTHIGNKYFSWFESTESKSRINFLKLLRAGYSDFAINMDATCYMQSNKLPQAALGPIIKHQGMIFANDDQWNDFLAEQGIVKDRHIQIATEGVLIGSIIEHGISENLVILSDDAGQFNVLLHALCWIHANRAIDKIIPFSEQAKKDLKSVKDQIWRLYKGLKKYKENPNAIDKKRLETLFDAIFMQKTACATLNAALGRIFKNKSELLLVLERPEIPLHNNGSERDIREYVKKRKISGSTRSNNGRKCRDTFTSLKKTCRKLGVSFWRYLKDRIEKTSLIPDLSELIRQRSQYALEPG